jgi:glycosyltransferase involved in cell wall biosynthesis
MLTLAIITRDSARFVERLLRGASAFADEIIVGVDASSSDDTERICASYADRVFRLEPFGGYVEPALAWLNEQCRGDWILRLDDDELISTGLVNILPELMADRDVTHHWIARRWLVGPDSNRWLGGAPWWPDWQLRLFRNISSLVRVPGQLHAPYEIQGACRYVLDGVIYHYDRVYHSDEERRLKVERYERLVPGHPASGQYLACPTDNTRPVPVGDRPWEPSTPPTASVESTSKQAPAITPVVLADLERAARRNYVLGPELFRADMAVLECPGAMTPGSTHQILVQLGNPSTSVWARGGDGLPEVSVSYHWLLGGTQEVHVWDGARTRLPRSLRPGEDAIVPVRVEAPLDPGTYQLQLDLLIEGLAWFSTRAWPAPTIDVRVHPTRLPALLERSRVLAGSDWRPTTENLGPPAVETQRPRPSTPAAAQACSAPRLPTVLVIVDIPSWAHDLKTQHLQRCLGSRFRMVKRYQTDVTREDLERADLVVVYYWQQIQRLAHLTEAFYACRDRLLVGVCSHHELEGDRREPGLRVLNSLARAVFVVNADLVREYAPVLSAPVFLTPNGVDTRFFRPGARAKEPTLRVGWAGSLSNHGPALRGFHDLIVPAVQRVDGAALFSAVREERWRTHTEMREFYRSLDVYVCASRSEGTPNPGLEAAACGVPIVTTRVGNMPAIVRHGVSGLFADRNVTDLAAKLAELRDEPVLRLQMGRTLRRLVVHRWDWRRQARNYERMFSTILTR